MRTLLYARYSSALQDKRSIDDQLRVCRERCAREGWEVVDVFTDYEISGKIFARPGLQAMLDRVVAGGIDQVMAEALDRFARDEVDTPFIRRKVEFAGARIFTLAQGEVTELHTALQGAMDAMELKKIAARVRRGQRGYAAAGKMACGRAYGYRMANRIRDDGSVEKGLTEIDPAEAAVVRWIVEQFGDKDASVLEMARSLNARRVPPPSCDCADPALHGTGQGCRHRWRVSTINGDRIRKNGMLHNELYRGRLVYNKTRKLTDPETRRRVIRSNPREDWLVTEVPHLAIVDEAAWRKVEARRERLEGVPFHRQKRPKRLLSGLGRCAVCGSGWVVITVQAWGCAGRRDGTGCTNNRTISHREYERRVLLALKERLLAPEAVALYVREYGREYARLLAEHQAGAADLHRRLEESETRIANFVAAIGGAGGDIPELVAALAGARRERDAARAALDAAPPPAIPLHPGLAESYRRNFEKVELAALSEDAEARREAGAALRGLIERIDIRPAGAGERGVNLDLHGRLATVLALAAGQRPPAHTFKPVPAVGLVQEQMTLRACA